MSHKHPLIAAWIIVALVLNASPAAFVFPVEEAFAQTAETTWNGSEDDDWNNAANWTPGTVPTDGIVTIPAGTPNSPTLTGSFTYEEFYVLGEAGMNINGSLTVTMIGVNNGDIGLYGTLTVPVEGSFTNGGQINIIGTLTNNGTFTNNGTLDHTYGGTINGTITNNGEILCLDGGEWDGSECGPPVVRTWTGAEGEAWENEFNWQEGVVPIDGDTVIIPSGTSTNPQFVIRSWVV